MGFDQCVDEWDLVEDGLDFEKVDDDSDDFELVVDDLPE